MGKFDVLYPPSFQFIDSPVNLLEIDDVFSIPQFESNQTTLLKEILGVSCRNESGCFSFLSSQEFD